MNTKVAADPMATLFDTQAYDNAQQAMVPAGGQARTMEAAGTHGANSLTTGVQGDVFQAQRVAAPRNLSMVMGRLKALAAAAGKNYVYGWEVNDKANNRKTWIEGPTIKLANDLAREYGNCMVDVRVRDEGANWNFYGRFMDLETGYTLVRAYQQRKGQKTGMKDDQRALDMVFQIGQSKCIRNVVINALQSLADFCVQEAKGALLGRVQKNPDAARQWIVKTLAELNIDQKRVSSIYGRTADHWTVPDMVRIYTEIQTIQDGMMDANDVYPMPQAAEPAAATIKTTGSSIDANESGAAAAAQQSKDAAEPAGQASGQAQGPSPGDDPDPATKVGSPTGTASADDAPPPPTGRKGRGKVDFGDKQ